MKKIILILVLVFAFNAQAAVMSRGVKIKVSRLQVKNQKVSFTHKKAKMVFDGIPQSFGKKMHGKKEIFLTFEEFDKLLGENQIALGGIAGGGGGK